MNSTITRPAKGRMDTLRRIAAKQGWYDAQANRDCETPGHYTTFEQRSAYEIGYAMGNKAPADTKHPFGEIANPRVPA